MPLRPTILATALAALLACGGGPADAPPEVVELVHTAGVDEGVVALIAEHVARARSRPTDAEARATLAMVFEANELWSEAEQAWRDALAFEDENEVWRYHLAICARQRGGAEEALELVRRVAKALPDMPGARHRLGAMLLEAGDEAGARREFEAAIELVDFAPPCYVGLAEVMVRTGDPARAAQLCRRALALDPESKHAHYTLGLAYRDLGRMDEAEVELNKGLNASRRYLSDPLTKRIERFRVGYTVRMLEANRLEKAGKLPEAAAILESLLLRHPQDHTLLNNLAAVLTRQGKTDRALELLGRAAEVTPGEFSTHINLAACYLDMGNFPLALENAEEACRLAPKVGQAHFVRARAYLALGRTGEAYAELKEAAALDSTAGIFRALLGEVAGRLGEHDAAVEHLEAAIRMMPGYLPAFAVLCRLHHGRGERREALEVLQRTRQAFPNHPETAALGRLLGAQ
ncbi:MAG: tetratricopeptide repeat protein [Planctomycetota bacterium]|jgi:tetratricopeptide (TPR) repeat protein|nr:tetratricopeptide repeat protein [Planctomycetota bacterium]MDP6763099.1 tetratricopeptide repeat protein [Planctomycetota bacterium]MDP6990897.1 tetratricopeptide repeat protein [Planctomycetota bacterium]